MNGFVDDKLRALIVVPVAATSGSDRTDLNVWIDTAFNGGLVIPRKRIESLELIKESSAEAILADGKTVELETYACFFDWLVRRVSFNQCTAFQYMALRLASRCHPFPGQPDSGRTLLA